MTRDALAQLLLCYIGTAADIIEFFDSFKAIIFDIIIPLSNPWSGPEGEHGQGPLPGGDVHLVLVTHAVHHHCPCIQGQCRAEYPHPICIECRASPWTWMLLVVIKPRRSVVTWMFGGFWSLWFCRLTWNNFTFPVLKNYFFQDAPFFAFRLVIIIHYRLISSMNLFCTAKNTLVITLQVCLIYME